MMRNLKSFAGFDDKQVLGIFVSSKQKYIAGNNTAFMTRNFCKETMNTLLKYC